MKLKLISFDLQGTLSESKFSDEFWLELIPRLYAEKKNLLLEDAKKEIEKQFQQFGRYDLRYYSHQMALLDLKPDWVFKDILLNLKSKPFLYSDTLEIVKSLFSQIPLIITSATTMDFIEEEIGDIDYLFKKVYSAINHFNTAGKTAAIYQQIAKEWNILPEEVLHIGDSYEMDIKNAQEAGLNTFYFNPKMSREQVVRDLKETLKKYDLQT